MSDFRVLSMGGDGVGLGQVEGRGLFYWQRVAMGLAERRRATLTCIPGRAMYLDDDDDKGRLWGKVRKLTGCSISLEENYKGK